ncbi:hypothetical protein ILUMI_26323 [Ignelater luminosus]|uniref:Uncharacterized protein n=1 Tax=Ignelater luminosus TaxID=2038154 RepID=A0A8K0C4G8_IGNLU|nr:hypothetical protein ILUMI_26323 [Ignelater luminosus]
MDETSLKLNKKPEYVIAKKSFKNVAAVISSEKGEIIKVIAVATRTVALYHGRTKFEDGMPPPLDRDISINLKAYFSNECIMCVMYTFEHIQQGKFPDCNLDSCYQILDVDNAVSWQSAFTTSILKLYLIMLIYIDPEENNVEYKLKKISSMI